MEGQSEAESCICSVVSAVMLISTVGPGHAGATSNDKCCLSCILLCCREHVSTLQLSAVHLPNICQSLKVNLAQ